MKYSSHTEHHLGERGEKSAKSSIEAPTGQGLNKQRKTGKDEPKKVVKETIESLHAAIAKETEASMENLIMVAIGEICRVRDDKGKNYEGVFGGMDSKNGQFMLFLPTLIVFDEKTKEERVRRTKEDKMKFVRGGYVSIHFPKMHLGTHIKDTLHESTKLVGDPRRDLQKFFVGGEGDLEMDLDNEKDDDWDQFKVNELKHNVVTTFDPSKYTTELNMKALSKKQIEVGAAIAESIENAPSASYHIREDRGQIKRSAVEEDEDDEERAYSAVIGTGNYKDGSTKINRKNQLGNTRQVKPRHIDNANGNGKKKFDRGKEVGKAKPVKQDKKETLDSKPVALPTFTNSKKNMEMKQSIEAALGMKIEKPATEEVKKDTEQPLAETKSPSAKIVDQDTAKKQSSQTNLSVAAKEFKPKPKDTPLSPNIPPKGKEEIKGHTAAATPQLESKPKLNTGAKDFTPKTVASVKPEPKAETKLSLALKTTAKEFKPSSHVTTKEAPTPANIVTLTIKPLANSNLVNLRATYKQFEKKKVVPTIAKDTWTTSPEITIKEVKPQPATPVYDNSTAQQPQYYYDGYYTGYYPPQQYYGMGYYPQGVNMYGGNGMYGYQGQEQMQGMAYPERGYLPNK